MSFLRAGHGPMLLRLPLYKKSHKKWFQQQFHDVLFGGKVIFSSYPRRLAANDFLVLGILGSAPRVKYDVGSCPHEEMVLYIFWNDAK